MFNFASKLINTIGDLVSIEEPPKPQQQSPQTQQRRASGDTRNFSQKPRFQGLTSDENTFRGPGTVREIRPSAPIYRYPSGSSSTSYGPANSSSTYGPSSTTAYGSSNTTYVPATTSTFGTTTTNYSRPEQYEEPKFKTQDIDYNEDGYNTGGNFDNERQSYITEIQKEYGMYREHDNNDFNDFEEEDRYSPSYDHGNRRLLNRENSQLKNTKECNDNAMRTNVDRNYYDSRQDRQHTLPASDTGFLSAEFYNSSENADKGRFSTNDIAQFGNTKIWGDENEYHKTRWKDEETLFENKEKLYQCEQEDKLLPSPPLQDEEAKNSSRSESESSDEISFGEALATGLITPEMAARMNFELINHPKTVIESFYGHSPGEVYTIPEEEDEICSPTGADGVTSLRKQRMASARVETSSNVPRDLQNQKRMPSINQSEQKLKYSGGNVESCIKFNQRFCTVDSKGVRMIKGENEIPNVGQKIQPNVNSKLQSDQGNSKLFQQQLQQQFQTAQMYERLENRPQPQQSVSDSHSQVHIEGNFQQMYRQDSRPNCSYYAENRQPQAYMIENRQSVAYPPDNRLPHQSNSDNRIPFHSDDRFPQSLHVDNQQPQGYCDNRLMQQGIATDHRLQQPIHPADQLSRSYSDNRAAPPVYSSSNRQQPYTVDNQQFQSTNNNHPPPPAYTNDNRSFDTMHANDNRPFQPPPLQVAENRSQNMYCNDNLPPSFATDNRSRQSGCIIDNRHPSLMHISDPRLPRAYPTDNREIPPGYSIDKPFQQGYTNNNRPAQQGYQGDDKQAQSGYSVERSQQQGYANDNRPLQSNQFPFENKEQKYYIDNKITMQGYSGIRPPQQGYLEGRPVQQTYYDTRSPQQVILENQTSLGYSADHQKGYLAQELKNPNQHSQQCPSHESPQRPPPNQGYNQELHFVNREQDNEDRRNQNFQLAEFQNQSNRGPRRQLPERQDSLPDQSIRKKLPLRKYNSEERYGSNQVCEGQKSISRSFENPEDEYDHQERFHRTKYDKSRHRSSSLDSQERNDQYYSRSRSLSLDRTQEDQEFENQNRQIMEPKKMTQRGVQFDEQDFKKKSATKQVQRSPLGQPRSTVIDKTRKPSRWTDCYIANNDEKSQRSDRKLQTACKDPKKSTEVMHKSRQQIEVKKGENFCLQHKKFTSNVNTATKPGRRMLPKEPIGQSSQRRNFKQQTQDKSTVSSKSEDSAHRRAGILSNASRKVERSGNLKISFSDPISNLLKPNNRATSIREDHATKTISTKNDKPTISTNVISSKNYVYPTIKEKTSGNLEINPSSISVISRLHRNQSLDTALKDNSLISSPNARSLPVPIVNRARSLDRYSSSETNLNVSPYFKDQFSRPGSAPGLMYEPVQQPTNSALQLSLYEMHALKKEERFWSDIYSALPADMKHLIANRGVGTTARKLLNNNTSFSVPSSPAAVVMGNHSIERISLENRIAQRGTVSKQAGKVSGATRDNVNSSLGERIGNRLRMLHEMKQQTGGFGNRRKSAADILSRRSASDGEYSFSSTTNFPLYWNLARRPHSDSAIDLLERLETSNPPTRISGSAYNSSEFLTMNPGCFRVVDKSQSYLTSPLSNVPPSPTPTQPVRLRDTALRGDHTESTHVSRNFRPGADNRSGFFR